MFIIGGVWHEVGTWGGWTLAVTAVTAWIAEWRRARRERRAHEREQVLRRLEAR